MEMRGVPRLENRILFVHQAELFSLAPPRASFVSRTFTALRKRHHVDRVPAPLRVDFDPWREAVADNTGRIERSAADKNLQHLPARNLRALFTVSQESGW